MSPLCRQGFALDFAAGPLGDGFLDELLGMLMLAAAGSTVRTLRCASSSAALNEARLDPLAEELVRERVDLIVAVASLPTRAAQRATRTIPIPIVMAGVSDPVRPGFVTNLGRPEANITGTSLLITELSAKRLELLKEAIPKLVRVTILYNPKSPGRDVCRFRSGKRWPRALAWS